MTGDQTRAQLAEAFRRFAIDEAAGGSPLYERLAHGVADDDRLLSIAERAPAGQPAPNLLFGAVHRELHNHTDDPLAAYYPSLGGSRPADDGDPLQAFRSFAIDREEPIDRLLATRTVQTNEVRRTAGLALAFALIAARTGHQPLAVVEVGAAAGLLLNWHRYRYNYGDGRVFGPRFARFTVCTSLDPHRETPVDLLEHLPEIAFAAGIDRNPLNTSDPEDISWLRSLVWPEDLDRARRLDQAIEVARAAPVSLIEGDALNVLMDVIADAPEGAPLIVFHSHTLNQFEDEARRRFDSLLTLASVGRKLYRVSQEGQSRGPTLLELRTYSDGLLLSREHLADVHPHGEWVRWSGPTS